MRESEIMIPIVLFIAAAAVFITYISAKHRERMSMIAKGMSSEDIKALYTRETKSNPLGSMKWGILFIMAGLAVLIGNYLHNVLFVDEGVIIGMICLFVGIGLLLFYGLAARKLGQQ
jgi:CBS domain containing-hemolysin-like protein